MPSWFKIEYVALTVNLIATAFYLSHRPLEPGKVLYWLGASTLTFGLSLMKG